MDSCRDTYSTKVSVRTDNDDIDGRRDLVDQPKERIRWLTVAPNHRDFGVCIADGFGGLPVFDDEQNIGAWNDIEGDFAVGW